MKAFLKDKPLLRLVGSDGPSSAPSLASKALRSPGMPLASAVRALMEPRFGHDFSHVRIHTDARAAESARAVGALAYTVGRDVVFGPGQYTPGTQAGNGLLAHELAHVVQQASASPPPLESLRIGAEGDAAEHQAEHLARQAAAGRPVARPSPMPPRLMRATRTFALTFDDGPHTAPLGKNLNRTERVLDTLKARAIKAAFFVQTGVSFRGASPEGRALIQRMAEEGHTVGIHTGGPVSHEIHPEAEAAGRLEGELTKARKYVKEQTGHEATMVRPPKGIYDKAVSATYARVGLTNVLWDLDGDQGLNLSLATLRTRIEEGIKYLRSRGWTPSTPSKNLVVLYHDIQANTSRNLGTLVDHIKATTRKVSGGKDTADFGEL